MSFLIATFNRRDVLVRTLNEIGRCGLPAEDFEVIVVDNASTDGTATAVADRFPRVKLVKRRVNLGPCAKNAGLAVAQGEFVVFLDDDSFPRLGAIRRMIEHFKADPLLGAAVFTVTLPNGSQECSAYPDVCIGCGTGLRRAALTAVGGLPDDFFMAAEEYDLSLRLLGGGWRISTFGDLHVTHLKTSASRFPSRITRLDARNNVLLAMRYFPEPWRMKYVWAWLERYRLMALANRNQLAFWRGAIQGVAKGIAQAQTPVGTRAFEQFAKLNETRLRLSHAARELGIRRILFVDVGKNFLAYHEAAVAYGLEIAGIADARLGGHRFKYRGLPVLTDDDAARCAFDAVIVSNLSPVHANQRTAQWRRRCHQRIPVIDLFAATGVQRPAALAA